MDVPFIESKAFHKAYNLLILVKHFPLIPPLNTFSGVQQLESIGISITEDLQGLCMVLEKTTPAQMQFFINKIKEAPDLQPAFTILEEGSTILYAMGIKT